jgi:hypothetical protein
MIDGKMIRLEILALVPTSYDQCASCETLYDQAGIGEKVHQEMLRAFPAELLQDHARLSSWVEELSRSYGASIQIRVIDPQSGVGLYKCLRHRVRRYPAFIINGKTKHTGWDRDALDLLLQAALGRG